jgi:uncharacterized protein
MAFLEKKLVVKKSTLPGAGKGLFTTVDIPKKKRIVEYKGTRSLWKDVKDDDGKNGYIFYITSKNVIDALPHKEALARYANDARGLTKVAGVRNNAEYIIDEGRCYIDAMRDIPAGSEILVSYTADYWRTIKANMKLSAAEKKKNDKKAPTKKKKTKSKRSKGKL